MLILVPKSSSMDISFENGVYHCVYRERVENEIARKASLETYTSTLTKAGYHVDEQGKWIILSKTTDNPAEFIFTMVSEYVMQFMAYGDKMENIEKIKEYLSSYLVELSSEETVIMPDGVYTEESLKKAVEEKLNKK